MDNREEFGRDLYELGLRLGCLGPVIIGASGGSLADALARSAGCGAVLSGSEVYFHDGSCAACGVWLVKYYAMSASLFVRQVGGSVDLFVNDGKGRPFEPPAPTAASGSTGSWDLLAGADCGWAARRASGLFRAGAAVVDGTDALRMLLERVGYDVLERHRPGVPLLRTDREGFRLTVEQNGRSVTPPGEDALSAAINWLSCGRLQPQY